MSAVIDDGLICPGCPIDKQSLYAVNCTAGGAN